MKGHIDQAGKVTITFHIHNEQLEGPAGLCWLPCWYCGRLKLVEKNVVSVTCSKCQEAYERNGVYPLLSVAEVNLIFN